MASGAQVSENSVIVKVADHLSCEVGEDTAILNFGNNTYFGLNEVGSVVWKMLAKPMRVGEIRNALVEEFEVDPRECLQDVISLISNLLEHQLVTQVEQ